MSIYMDEFIRENENECYLEYLKQQSTMKTTSKEVREMIISRFFKSFNELPHEIEKSNKADDWQLFKCVSSNNSAMIGYKTRPQKQVCMWSFEV